MPISPEENDQRIIDKYLNSLNVYWGALLTINGLLFSFFSVDSILSKSHNPILNYILVIACSISLILIIFNFRAIKKNYYELGHTKDEMPHVPEELLKQGNTPEERERIFDEYTKEWRLSDLEKTRRRQKFTRIRETIIEILVVIEICIVLVILFTSQAEYETSEKFPIQSIVESDTTSPGVQDSTKITHSSQ